MRRSGALAGRPADAFFIALMGPGVSLAPMVLSFALAPALSASSPLAAEFFVGRHLAGRRFKQGRARQKHF